MPRNGSKTAGTTTIAEPLRTDRRGQSRNAANVSCAAAPSTTILAICVQRRGSNTIMMSDFTPMAFGSFGRISFGLRAQTIIAAPIVVPEIIVGFVHDLMDIVQEM